jgi:hypothetical protein
MPQTFTLIASSTVGSGGASNITFSSIPSTYTDLCIKASIRTAYSDQYDGLTFTFNGSTANFTTKQLYGTGSTAASNSSSSNGGPLINANTSTSSTFGNAEIYIPNYTGSNNKSVSSDGVTENNATQAFGGIIATLWSQSAAITSITLGSANASNYLQHSTAYLYGIKKD